MKGADILHLLREHLPDGGVFLDNLYGALTGKLLSEETNWDRLGNAALFHIDRKTFTGPLDGVPGLTARERRLVRRFYAPYVCFITDRYHRLYKHQSGGVFDPRYIPEDLYFMHIDRHFSDRAHATEEANKCLYYERFPDVKLPYAVALRMDGIWKDGDGNRLSPGQVLERVGREKEVIIKKAVNSECGKGIFFCSAGGQDTGITSAFRKVIKDISCDVVVQRLIRQHPALGALHAGSVNTMRIISMRRGDKVKVFGAIVKFGVGDARVDNSSSGGIICGVDPETGRLSSYGLYHDGSRCTRHPDLGYAFSDMTVPHPEKAFELVKRAHMHMDRYGIIGWDVTIDEEEEAVLVEANLCLGSINAFQVFHGPLFGRDTKKILDEVFRGKRRLLTTLF